MPTTTTKHRKPAVERRTNHKKRKHRTWIWWILVIAPILLSIWLFILPELEDNTIALKSTRIEKPESVVKDRVSELRRRSPASGSAMPSQPPAAAGEESADGGISEDTKDDVDWVMGHLYKFLPLVFSLIAIFKKGAIMGRSS